MRPEAMSQMPSNNMPRFLGIFIEFIDRLL
jgi:hypothetical protein